MVGRARPGGPARIKPLIRRQALGPLPRGAKAAGRRILQPRHTVRELAHQLLEPGNFPGRIIVRSAGVRLIRHRVPHAVKPGGAGLAARRGRAVHRAHILNCAGKIAKFAVARRCLIGVMRALTVAPRRGPIVGH